MVILQNVSKTFQTEYGEVKAVCDVNLRVEKGEIYGVIGLSGAGKSTLIRCINLLEEPTAGSVIVDNVDMMRLSKKARNESRKKIGMIFQHFYLMPSRTVLNNVLFPLKGAMISKSEKHKKAIELLELVGLSHRVDAYPSALSGGEKQRVAIARALANDPSVLLCDEATSALDPQTTKSILKLLKKINQECGITIVLITHDMAVIKEICDHVAVMEDGEIKEQGDVFEVFSNPQSEVAKEFVASTNNLHKVYELLERGEPIVQTEIDERLLKLSYTPQNTRDSLLYEAAKQFHVSTNICFGSIELVQGYPFGYLVIIMKGCDENISAAIKFLQEKDVTVEVLSKC